MINTASLSSQLLSEGASKSGGQKNKTNIDDLLLAGQNGYANFQTLLSGANASSLSAARAISKIMATASIEKADTTISADILLTALKSLSSEQLAALNIDPDKLAGDFAGTLPAIENTPSGILQSLSNFSLAASDNAETFTIIDDPKLAEALAGLADKIADALAAANSAANIAALQNFQSTLQQVFGKPLVIGVDNVNKLLLNPNQQQGLTITVADLNGDGFQALKKLAFADIAPFLTMPRTVRIDNNTVMKVAQGPSFLNDGTTDANAMTLVTGLVSVFVKAQAQANATDTAATGLALANNATGSAGTTALSLDAAQQALNAPQSPLSADFAATLQAAAKGMPSATTAAGTPLMITVTPSSSATRGFESVAKGLDNGLADPASFDLSTAFDEALSIRADQALPTNTSTTLIAAKTAAQPHPSTQMVATIFQRAAHDAANGQPGERQFTIQLDPRNMGRLKITLEFSADNTVKAKLIAERPETVAMLQKDSHLLERALNDSGFDTSAQGAVTFNLGDDSAFSQNRGGGHSGGEGQKNAAGGEDGTDFAIMETVMPVFVDPVTGLTHINVVI